MSLGFGDFVPLANAQRTGESLYSRWFYFIFTVSFILFGLALMASSLNLLVLRLARFHSENSASSVPAFVSPNEEDPIVAAITHHSASIQMEQQSHLYSNTSNTNQHSNVRQSYTLMSACSWYTSSLSSSSNSNSKINFTQNSEEQSCCSVFSLFNSKKRRRRHWHLRRSPQNIKHLLNFEHVLEDQRLALLNEPLSSYICHPRFYLKNHVSKVDFKKQHRTSI